MLPDLLKRGAVFEVHASHLCYPSFGGFWWLSMLDPDFSKTLRNPCFGVADLCSDLGLCQATLDVVT